MSESRLITASAYSPSAKALPLTQFHLESKREVRRMDMDRPLFEKRIQTAGAAPTEVLFGPASSQHSFFWSKAASHINPR